MKRTIVILVFSITVVVLTKAQTLCDFVNKIQGYQQSITLNFKSIPCTLDSSFNLTTYLSMFDQIKVSPGLKSYVYYDYGILDGSPIIYVLPENYNLKDTVKKRVEKKTEYKYLRTNLGLIYKDLRTRQSDTVGNYENQQYLYYTYINDSTRRASNNMIPENSDDGFFQYLFFNTMGEQFALFWHAGYFQKRIICSEVSLKVMINDYKDSDSFEVDKNKLNSLIKIDTSIGINSTDKKYFITWYELETHKGFYKRSYEIDRDSPYKIRLIKSDKILEIGLNFMY
jgi:hypothetical protein